MRYFLFPLFVVFQMQAKEVLFEGHVFDNKLWYVRMDRF